MTGRIPDEAEQLVLIGDPAVLAVPVADNGEPLRDVGRTTLRVDERLADELGHYRLVRAGVVTRLEQAASALPPGWRLTLIEGFRPIALQRKYFDEYAAVLRQRHTALADTALSNEALSDEALSEEELYRLTTRHIAPVLPSGHPPHSTGGAVDLTVYDDDGQELELGCAVNETPEESGGRCFTTAPDLSRQARTNRDVLIAALSAAGMINYPPEWWHWSYGDQYWAMSTGASTTRYARIEL